MADEVAVTRLKRQIGAADLERINLPRDLWATKVQNVAEGVRDIIHRYLIHIDKLVERGAGMYLFGPSGVGKSGIGALCCKEARSRGFTAYFISVWELRECFKTNMMFEDTTSVLERCKEVDLLVLDGLCPEDAKDRIFGARAIEELVAYRGGRRHVTIITSRMMPDELETFGALVDVMQGSIVFVHVEGQNLRRLKNAELKKAVFGG